MAEKLVAAFRGWQGQVGGFGAPKLFDVVFTNQRLVALAGGTMVGGLEGALAMAYRARKAQANPVDFDVSHVDALAAAQSGSFSLPYASVQKVKLSGMLGKMLTLRSGKQEYFLYPPKKDLDQVSKILDQLLAHAR